MGASAFGLLVTLLILVLVIVLLVVAVLPVLLAVHESIQAVTSVSSARRAVSRSLQLRTAARMRDLAREMDKWLVRYYRDDPHLHVCKIGGVSQQIPVLSPGSWRFDEPRRVDPDTSVDSLIEVRATSGVGPYTEDRALLDRKVLRGARVFESMYKSLRVAEVCEGPRLIAESDSYRVIDSSASALEIETFTATRRANSLLSRWRAKSKMRDQHFPATGELYGERRAPFFLGSPVVLALRTQLGYEVLLHKRSREVGTSPGRFAVLPNYGYEDNRLPGGTSTLGVMLFNFVKEYLEEIFNKEELVGASRRMRPDWFVDDPLAQRLLKSLRNGSADLFCLGVGVECISGSTVLAMLAVVDDEAVLRDIDSAHGSWEGEGASFSFVETDDHVLGAHLADGAYKPDTAWALSLALPVLADRVARRLS